MNIQDSNTHPYAVWEIGQTGQTLRTFADEDLAMQFVIDNGGKIIDNPTKW